jgi:hypothetical protein
MQPRLPNPNRIVANPAALLLTLVVAACSSGNMEVSPRPDVEEAEELARTDWPTAINRSTQAAGCANDDVRVCSYYLPEHNGVRPCVIGYQICSDDTWSRCTEGVPQDAGVIVGADAGAQ